MTTQIKDRQFKHKKSGKIYILSNVVYNMDGTVAKVSEYLSGFQLKDGNLYGRSRTFHPSQVEEIK